MDELFLLLLKKVAECDMGKACVTAKVFLEKDEKEQEKILDVIKTGNPDPRKEELKRIGLAKNKYVRLRMIYLFLVIKGQKQQCLTTSQETVKLIILLNRGILDPKHVLFKKRYNDVLILVRQEQRKTYRSLCFYLQQELTAALAA